MTLLLELPNDLLCEILDVLKHDTATLIKIAKVCLRLATIAQPFIFRHLYPITLSEDQRMTLEKVLAERPRLKEFVWSYDVRIHVDCKGQPDMTAQASHAISSFPNLRQVYLIREAFTRNSQSCDTCLCWKGWTCNKVNCGQLKRPEQPGNSIMVSGMVAFFTRISTVYLDAKIQADFSSTDIVHLMLQLPNLRHLRAGRLASLGAPQISDELSCKTSRLTSLEIYGNANWSCEVSHFREILSFCPRLRELRAFIPLLTRSIDDEKYYKHYQSELVTKLVSPTAYEWMLEPIRGSLRHLTLLDPRYDTKYDGSVMSFAQYPELAELYLSGCCVLPPGRPGPERHELYLRLPNNLRSLRLDFPPASGVLFDWNEVDPNPEKEWIDLSMASMKNNENGQQWSNDVLNTSGQISRMYHTRDEEGYQKDPDPGPRDDFEHIEHIKCESRSAWFHQFIKHKSTHFPRLREIVLRDTNGPWEIEGWPFFTYDGFSEKRKMIPFEDANINLKVSCKAKRVTPRCGNWLMQPNEYPGYPLGLLRGNSVPASYLEDGWAPTSNVISWLRYTRNTHISQTRKRIRAASFSRRRR